MKEDSLHYPRDAWTRVISSNSQQFLPDRQSHEVPTILANFPLHDIRGEEFYYDRHFSFPLDAPFRRALYII